jgi:hypothetical protein
VTENDELSPKAIVILHAFLESLNRCISLREFAVNLSRSRDFIHDLSSAALKAAPEEATADSARDAKTAADRDAAVPEKDDHPGKRQDYAHKSCNREKVPQSVSADAQERGIFHDAELR